MARDLKNTAIFVAHEDCEPSDKLLAERNLLRAVLLGAMSDLDKSGSLGAQAREYFLSAEEDYLFSFRAICDFLALDPNTVLILAGLKDSPLLKRAGGKKFSPSMLRQPPTRKSQRKNA